MIQEISTPFLKPLKRLAIAILIGGLVEIIFSFYLAYSFNSSTVHYLNEAYVGNQQYTSAFVNEIFDWVKHSFDWIWGYLDTIFQWCVKMMNYASGYLGLKAIHSSPALLKAIYLSFLIYLQKVVVSFASMITYFGIFLVFLFDGIYLREMRRYRVAPESINQNWNSINRAIEYIMYTGYIAVPVISYYISPIVWFLGFSLCLCWLHRRQIEYIQKYL